MDKHALLAAVVGRLENSKRTMQEQMKEATATAMTYPGGGRSHSDTYKFQHQERADLIEDTAQEIEGSIDCLNLFELDVTDDNSKVAIGSLVKVTERFAEEAPLDNWYFIVPGEHGAGEMTLDSEEVYIVPAKAPVAKKLIGHCVGEKVKITTENGPGPELEIQAIE